MSEFVAFDKIPRFSQNVVITEKIDGTNAQIFIEPAEMHDPGTILHEGVAYRILAGSRNRWITPADDNYGFAKWVKHNSSELVKLGQGRHFGEWWGQGIQRRYGLEEKRFSLFNTARWMPGRDTPPSVCHVVPVLYQGPLSAGRIDEEMKVLRQDGSIAAPGFDNPEGIVIYHTASRTLFKKTFEYDETGKGQAAPSGATREAA